MRSDDEESFEEEIDSKNNGINGDKRIKTVKVTHNNVNDKTATNSKLWLIDSFNIMINHIVIMILFKNLMT